MLWLLWVLLRVAVTATATSDIEVLVAVLALPGGHHRRVVLILGGLGSSSTAM